MKSVTTWRRNNPSTAVGESITITHTISSFNTQEIDELQKTYEHLYGNYTIAETEQNE